MQQRALCLVLGVLLLGTSGCSVVKRFMKPGPEPTPPTLASQRGVSTPLESAVRKISFRPFVPSQQIIDVAMLAPLRGDDVRANRGIAFEYVSGGRALVLSEWPRHRTHLDVGGYDLAGKPCQLVTFKNDGALWTTRGGLVMTLQADGKMKPPLVFAEARRLLRSGACR